MTHESDATQQMSRDALRATLAQARGDATGRHPGDGDARGRDALARIASLLHELAFEEPPRWTRVASVTQTAAPEPSPSAATSRHTIEVAPSGQRLHVTLRSAARGGPGRNLAETLEAGYRMESLLPDRAMGTLLLRHPEALAQPSPCLAASACSHRGQLTLLASVAPARAGEAAPRGAWPWLSWRHGEPVTLDLAVHGLLRGAAHQWHIAVWGTPWEPGSWLIAESGRRVAVQVTPTASGIAVVRWDPVASPTAPPSVIRFAGTIARAGTSPTDDREAPRWSVTPAHAGVLLLDGEHAGRARWHGDARHAALAIEGSVPV